MIMHTIPHHATMRILLCAGTHGKARNADSIMGSYNEQVFKRRAGAINEYTLYNDYPVQAYGNGRQQRQQV